MSMSHSIIVTYLVISGVLFLASFLPRPKHMIEIVLCHPENCGKEACPKTILLKNQDEYDKRYGNDPELGKEVCQIRHPNVYEW